MGRTLRDLTGNGLSADDATMGGVTVKVFADTNNNGVLDAGDAVVASLVADANGLFTLSVSTPGSARPGGRATGYAQRAVVGLLHVQHRCQRVDGVAGLCQLAG